MDGMLYAVGVGPGDPDLLTLKAVKVLEKADIIACPAKENKPGIAYTIASQACPAILSKETLTLDFPMSKGNLNDAHNSAADKIIDELRSGKNVVFLTLGDPGFYSTFSYISDRIKKSGYNIEIINGIPSFCAAAAKIGCSIAEGEEPVLITTGEYVPFAGTLIIMKAGSRLKELKAEIKNSGKAAYLIENCGMQGEAVYYDVDSIPEKAGYFSIIIVKPSHN